MRRNLFLVFLLLTFVINGHAFIVQTPVDYVNPLVGSASKSELSTGNTYPAIALPPTEPIRYVVSSRLTNPAHGLMTTDSSLSCPLWVRRCLTRKDVQAGSPTRQRPQPPIIIRCIWLTMMSQQRLVLPVGLLLCASPTHRQKQPTLLLTPLTRVLL